jgi:hypothetical protein
MEPRYRIVRFFFNRSERPVIKEDLTLEEAKKHCNDPETSSRTAKSMDNYTQEHGPWFDGFEEDE